MTTQYTTRSENERIALSVVIIAENEEDRIRECIESVFDACRGVSSFEIILVDSASTDRTVDRATEYPITVVRIPEEHTVSCGAGRYVGDHFASGSMVLHVDGDMELTETWLPRAIERLREGNVAAVEGHLDESTATDAVDVDKIGGVMLYDAETLRGIGGFDPYLRGYEDIDVGYQLSGAGYRLLRLPEVSATHHEEESVSEPLRRWRQGYLTASGQTIRKWRRSPSMLQRLVRRQQYKLGLLGWAGVGLVSLVSLPLLLGWLLVSALGFGAVATRVGVAEAAQFFIAKAMGLVGLAVGLSHPTAPASEYPLQAVDVIADGDVHVGTETAGRGTGRAVE